MSGRLFTPWATREALAMQMDHSYLKKKKKKRTKEKKFISSVTRKWDKFNKAWPLKASPIIHTGAFIEDQISLTTALYDINIWLIES